MNQEDKSESLGKDNQEEDMTENYNISTFEDNSLSDSHAPKRTVPQKINYARLACFNSLQERQVGLLADILQRYTKKFQKGQTLDPDTEHQKELLPGLLEKLKSMEKQRDTGYPNAEPAFAKRITLVESVLEPEKMSKVFQQENWKELFTKKSQDYEELLLQNVRLIEENNGLRQKIEHIQQAGNKTTQDAQLIQELRRQLQAVRGEGKVYSHKLSLEKLALESRHEESMKKIQKESEQYQYKITQLEIEIGSLQMQSQDLKGKSKEAAEQLDLAQQENLQLSERVSSLLAKLQQAQHNQEKLLAQLHQMEERHQMAMASEVTRHQEEMQQQILQKLEQMNKVKQEVGESLQGSKEHEEKMRSELQEMRHKFQEMEETLQEMRKRQENIKQDSAQMKKQLQEKTEKLQQISKSQINEGKLSQTIAKYQQEIRQKDAEIKKGQDEMRARSDELRKRQDELRRKEKQIIMKQEKWLLEEEQLKLEVQTKNLKIEELQLTMGQKTPDLLKLEEALKVALADNQALKFQIGKLQRELQTYQRSIQEISVLEENSSQQLQQVKSHYNQLIQDMEKDNEELKEKIERKNAIVEILIQEKEDLLIKLQKQEKMISERETRQNEGQKAAVDKQTAEQLARLKAESKTLRDESSKYKGEVKRLSGEISKEKEKKDKYKKQMNDLRQKLSVKISQLERAYFENQLLKQNMDISELNFSITKSLKEQNQDRRLKYMQDFFEKLKCYKKTLSASQTHNLKTKIAFILNSQY